MRRTSILVGFLVLYTLFMHVVAILVSSFLANSTDGLRSGWDLLLSPSNWASDPAWLLVSIPTLLLVATQVVFLWPVVHRRAEVGEQGRTLWTTLSAAGLIAGVVVTAMILSFIDLTFLFVSSDVPEDMYEQAIGREMDGWSILMFPAALLATSWLVWTIVFAVFARRRQGTGRLSRWLGLLLQATIVEVVITIPIDIMVRRRTDCYCATASFLSICCSTWALLWLAGPGAVLALTSKRRRLFGESNCTRCGHAKGPSPGKRCPECGGPW